MHTLHGRALAVATGAQLGNHRLKVVVTGGDGDGFGIGGNHFVHVMRRNVDLTYIVMDNQILRPHHWTGLAHQPEGHEDEEHASWERGKRGQPDSRWPLCAAPPTSRAGFPGSRSIWSR